MGAAEAARSIERIESRDRRTLGAAAAGLLLVFAAAGAALRRRRSGSTFSEWLAAILPRHAARARSSAGSGTKS